MKRTVLGLTVLFLLTLIAFSMIACGGGSDDAEFTGAERDNDGVLDDDDGSGLDDDDHGNDDDDFITDDDDDDNNDDDDASDGGININSPTNNEVINGTQVDVAFEYHESLSDIHVTIDQTDVTGVVTMSGGVGTGVIPEVEEGEHIIKVYGYNAQSDYRSDDVTFEVVHEGPLGELSLSKYQANVGETITWSYKFYDANMNDISDQVGPEVTMTNGAVHVGSNGIKLVNDGECIVTAKTNYNGHMYTDEKTVVAGDFAPPLIEITSPERGTFTQANAMNIYGVLYDDSAIKFLKYKDIREPESAWASVNVASGGQFNIPYDAPIGMNTIQFWASDEFDNESFGNISILRGPYNTDDARLTDSVQVRLNNHGFDTITQIAEDLINSIDFSTFLPANPVFSTDLEIAGIDVVSIAMDIDENEFSMGQINLAVGSAVSGNLDFTASIGAIQAEGVIYGDIFKSGTDKGIGYQWTIPVSASGATLSGDLVLWVNGGELFAELTNVDVSISNFHIGALPDYLDFVNNLISDAIRDLFLEDFIEDMVMEQVAPLILDAFKAMNQELNQDLDILGYGFELAIDFETLETVDNGITIKAKTRFKADSGGHGPKDQPGSYQTPSAPPVLGQYSPGAYIPYGFGFALDDDLLNQFLYEAYDSGLLSMRIDADNQELPLNWRTSDLALRLLFPELQTIHNDAPVAIVMRPQIFPIITFTNQLQKKGDTKNTVLPAELQMGDFLLDLVVEHPQDGDIIAFTLCLAVYLPVDITLDTAQNSLSMDFDTANMIFEVQTVEKSINFNEAMFEDFMPQLMEFVLPLISGVIGDITIPSFGGYSLDVQALEPIGTSGDWLGLYLELVGK